MRAIGDAARLCAALDFDGDKLGGRRSQTGTVGAWTLDRPCNRPAIIRGNDGTSSISVGVVGDAGILSVQRRVGSSVDGFSCIGPGYEREADGQKANELHDYVIGVNGAIPPEAIRIAK